MQTKQNNKKTKTYNVILILIFLTITIAIVIGLFALSKFINTKSTNISINFRKSNIAESDITYAPTETKEKEVEVIIKEQEYGKVQYKIGENGVWTDYTGKFTAQKSEVYARICFTDGIGAETVKQIPNIIEEPRVTINAQDMIVKDGLQMQLDGANNTGKGNFDDRRVWADLSVNNKDATIHGAIWDKNALVFNGSNNWVNCRRV